MAMDLITQAPLSPDSDTDTPPAPQPKRPYSLALTRSHAPPMQVSYKECLKNHAAAIGGHALDGCCEFMQGPTANPINPVSLTCAACGCHRNFHRRDPDDPTPLSRKLNSPAPSASQLLLSLSQHSSEDNHNHNHDHTHHDHHNLHIISGITQGQNGHLTGSSKKRHRTRFSQDQKERMYEFSEKIGWKLRKGEESLVEEFCKEVGVVRGVFKVWMHNNKHNSSRRERVIEQIQQHHQLTNNNNSNSNHLNVNLNVANGNVGNNNNNNSSTSNGINCGSNVTNVVHHHEFYGNVNAAPQEAQ